MKSTKLKLLLELYQSLALTALLIMGIVFLNRQPSSSSISTHSVLGVTASMFTVSASSKGTVTSSPAGINCGGDCSEAFDDGETIILTQTPQSGRTFIEWYVSIGNASGSSQGTCSEGNNKGSTCTVIMTSYGVSVYPVWEYSTYNATIKLTGSGSGTVTGTGVNCGADCSTSYGLNDTVKITATPDAGSKFAGWQPEGDWCYSFSGGKGSAKTANPEAICKLTSGYTNVQNKTIIAKFDVDASATPDTTETTTKPTTTDEEATKPEDKPAKTTTTAKLVDAEGNEIKLEDGSEKVTFKYKDPVIVSGTTVPKGIVKLYIFSEPQEATVTADAKGVWKYVATNLEPGDHRIEAEVTNPATGTTSKRAQVLAFAVGADEQPVTQATTDTTADTDNTSTTPLLIAIGLTLLVVVGGACVFWIWKKKKDNGSNTPSAPLM